MRRIAFALLVFVAVPAVVAGTIVTARAQVPASPVCRDAEGLRYSPGALIRHDDEVYRCFHVLGDGLTPAGVAWVQMKATFEPAMP